MELHCAPHLLCGIPLHCGACCSAVSVLALNAEGLGISGEGKCRHLAAWRGGGKEEPTLTCQCRTARALYLILNTDEVIPERVKNEDLSGTQTLTLCSKTSLPDQGTVEQNPLFLAAELQAFQKLYIPRSLPTAVLGAAARLATSSGHFCWFPGLRKMDE